MWWSHTYFSVGKCRDNGYLVSLCVKSDHSTATEMRI
jgi:hypothetical protein